MPQLQSPLSGLFDLLKIHPGEERISVLLVGLMLFIAAGGAIGKIAIEAYPSVKPVQLQAVGYNL